MTSRKIAALVICACLLMIGGVFAQEPEPTPTETPTFVSTDTPTNTDTPSPVPTDTTTSTATSTETPTITATHTATMFVPEVTAEITAPIVYDEQPAIFELAEPDFSIMNTESLEPWCYTWDFLASNGGFTPIPAGSGNWVSGQGWVGANITLSSVNRTLAQIQKTFTSTTLTRIEFEYYRVEGSINASPVNAIETLGIFINGTARRIQKFRYASTHDIFSWTGTISGATNIYLESQASWMNAGGVANGSTRLTNATLRGLGTNPFGMSNCDLPTPTVTPTETPTATPTSTPSFCVPTTGEASARSSSALMAPCNGSDGSGLRGDYYSGTNFAFLLGSRLDYQINYSKQGASNNWIDPYYFSYISDQFNVPDEDFSVIWTGFIRIYQSEMFRFCLRHDDGARLWVNDQLVVNNWNTGTVTTNCNDILIESSGSVPIRLEYFQENGDAVIELLWNSCGVSCSQHTQVFTASQWSLFPSQELAMVMPLPPGGDYSLAVYPLTTTRLRAIAEYIAANQPNLIFGTHAPPQPGTISWNGFVGRWFQNLVIGYSTRGIPPSLERITDNNTNLVTPLRSSSLFNGRLRTRPDGFGDVVENNFSIVSGCQYYGEILYPQALVVEIKAQQGVLTERDHRAQMMGMIDIARNQRPIGQNGCSGIQVGAIEIISTSDMTLSTTLIQQATSRQVVLCHAIVYEVWGANLMDSRLFIGDPQVINSTMPELVNFPATCQSYTASPVQVNVVLPIEEPPLDDEDWEEDAIGNLPHD